MRCPAAPYDQSIVAQEVLLICAHYDILVSSKAARSQSSVGAEGVIEKAHRHGDVGRPFSGPKPNRVSNDGIFERRVASLKSGIFRAYPRVRLS
jgi:hypothetical protein